MNATSIFHSTRDLIPLARAAPRANLSRLAAQGLGWFSILLGALEVVAPSQLAARLGFHAKEPLLRRYGSRGIAAGAAALVGFLGPAMWARVFGDLATLSIGRRKERHTTRNIAIAIAAVGGIVLLDVCIAALLSSRARR